MTLSSSHPLKALKNCRPHGRYPVGFQMFCLLLACSFLLGCGDKKKDPAPARAPVNNPPPAVPIPTGKPAEPELTKGTRKNKLDKTIITPEDRDDVFDASMQGNFSLMTTAEQNQWVLNHEATASIPQKSKNSNHYVITRSSVLEQAKPGGIKRLPENFTEIPEAGYSSEGYPRKILCEIDQSVMVLIPSGVFLQGKEGADENASPQISHYLDTYYIDEHEVTIEAFLKYRDYEISLEKRGPLPPANAEADPLQPALGMLWRDAAGYAQYVGKSLPSEAEWEKAARGAAGFDHPWGFGRPAWRHARTVRQLSVVMSYETDKSPYGVFDMAGNAGEWCADWYREDAYEQVSKEESGVPKNWKGPRSAKPKSHRVVKGNSSNWMLWHREALSLSKRDPRVGFRCVLRVESASNE